MPFQNMMYSSSINASIEEPYSQDIRKTSLLSNALSAWTDAASGAGGGQHQLAPGGARVRTVSGSSEVSRRSHNLNV